MSRSLAARAAVLAAAPIAAAALATAALHGTAGAAEASPATVVALGDSAASGEGAGGYAPGTRGENGDWCHRSPAAYVYRTGLPGAAIDLACSGATSADVGFAAPGHYGEPAQAQQLVDVARTHRVTTVVLQVGANDDVALTPTGLTCIRAFLDLTRPPCRTTLDPLVAGRVAATATKVEAAARDVQEAMRRAGYAADAYTLVLASYAAPISEHMVADQGLKGCPYSSADAAWGRTQLFPALSRALAGVAARVGGRFLDLDRATEGFEACTHDDSRTEWQRRITVDPRAFAFGGLDALGIHLAQESFHPSAAGHERIGTCLGALVRSGGPAGACVASPDGTAHLQPEQLPAAPVPAA